MKKEFKGINAENWGIVSAMFHDKRLEPKDVFILRLFFACMGKEWAYTKDSGIFFESCKAFFEFHKDNICMNKGITTNSKANKSRDRI